jgi:hypothetical protein
MNRHFEYKKNPCPTVVNKVELTDEIKQEVLTNRFYAVPKVAPPPAPPTLNQTINNIQYINNYVATLPSIAKLETYLAHQNIQTLPMIETLENKFQSKIQRLERLPASFVLKADDFLDTINAASSSSRIEHINIMYNTTTQKIHIKDGDKWSEYIEEKGIKQIMESIQEVYFDIYELYLIRKLHEHEKVGKLAARNLFEELLLEYYRFIVFFGLEPYIKDKTDSEILYNGDDEAREESESEAEEEEKTSDAMTIYDRYIIKFNQVHNAVTPQQRKASKKRVLDIIKHNCQASLSILNQQVADLFRMDENFKERLLTMH